MTSRSDLILASVLKVMRPLVALLLRNGVAYPAFSNALKRVFLEAARAELHARSMPATDSALTLLSGVHRRDVRTLGRGTSPAPAVMPSTLGLIGEVVARWMSDPACVGADGLARPLARGDAPGQFDALVAGVSRDVRPKAVLDELLRLGAAESDGDAVRLVAQAFAPRAGLAETASLFADNLHDHAAAAAANLLGDANFLEQAVYVDELTPTSAEAVQRAAVQAWRAAFQTVMREATLRFDGDATHAVPADRSHRVRVGIYVYSEKEDRDDSQRPTDPP